eukprot:361831-Chlamydomonas_euryale.AAC.2
MRRGVGARGEGQEAARALERERGRWNETEVKRGAHAAEGGWMPNRAWRTGRCPNAGQHRPETELGRSESCSASGGALLQRRKRAHNALRRVLVRSQDAELW